MERIDQLALAFMTKCAQAHNLVTQLSLDEFLMTHHEDLTAAERQEGKAILRQYEAVEG